MKKNSKIFIIGYLFFLMLNIVTSCDTCSCGPYPDKFHVTNFDWNLSEVTLTDNYYISSAIAEDEVNYNKYTINLYPEIETYFSNVFHFSMLNTAYACSCPTPQLTTTDKITNIEIISNSDFDNTHLAGSNVTEYFKIGYNDLDFQVTSISDYINLDKDYLTHLLFILDHAPENIGEFSFDVKITIEANAFEQYEFTTNPITITNN